MDVRLPKLGEGADSGAVVNLFVKEGDDIKIGQTILELENEKAVAPIPSPAEGRVATVRVKEGDKISVGQVLLTLAGPGVTTAAPVAERKAAAAEPRQKEPPPAEPEPVEAPARVSTTPPPAAPSIRKIARELGIDLWRVRGSESGGRIILADLRAYIARLQQLAFPAQPKAAAQPVAPKIDFAKWGPVTRQALSPLRQTIAQRMVESWTTIPRVTQFDEADITLMLELRKKHNPTYEQKEARLTLTPLVMKAAVEALKKFPVFNSSLDEDEIVFKEYFHIGLAVDTEAGLLVPVIRDVDKKTLLELSREVNALSEKARLRKFSLEELKGGSFTISNQGGLGGGHFTPIVHKPESAILGLGRATLKPAVREGRIEPRWLMPLAVSYDHRLIDGGQAARFTTELVKQLEQFPENELKLR